MIRFPSGWCVCLHAVFVLFTATVLAETPLSIPKPASVGTIRKPPQNMPQAPADGPDLIVSKFELVNGNPNTSEAFYIRLEVTNQGQTAAYYPANSKYCQYTFPGNPTPQYLVFSQATTIAPGKMIPDGISVNPGTAPVGNYALVAIADPANNISESNEDNNQRTYNLSITQGGTPDLVISEIRVVPPTATGATHSFLVTVKNQGNGPAYTKSGNQIVSCPDLGYTYPGNSVIFPEKTVVYSIQKTGIAPGNYNYTFTVDPVEKIAESNESNNNQAFPVQVK